MAEKGGSGADEWRASWPLVLTSMAGLSLSVVAINSIGLFMAPLQEAFGWSRAQVSSGLTIFAIVAVPLSPFVGGLIDRWGARRLAIPGLLLTAGAFSGFGLANGSIVQWWVLWMFYSLVALAIKTTIWTSAVSSMFDASRGLALAVTLCGSAIGATVAPVLARALIDEYGWRTAFAVIGSGWGLIALLLALAFFRDARDLARRMPVGNAAARSPLSGLDLAVALRDRAFVRIAATVLINTLLLVALVVHLVPILSQNGLPRIDAAWVASLMGVAALVGKLASGWLLDRFEGGPIASICVALPAIPCLMFWAGQSGIAFNIVAVLVFGLASGGQVQVTTYLTTRYVGLRNYGKIYGVLTSLIALATGTGPLIAGLVFDHFGGYQLVFQAGVLISIVCAFLMARLGPYPKLTAPLLQS